MFSDPKTEIIAHLVCPSPIGELRLTATPTGICSLAFDAGADPDPHHTESCTGLPDGAPTPILESAADQLEEYFAGLRHQFDLPLDTAGTSFQQDVWNALRGIPLGSTLSYRTLAACIARPQAMRAVGAACGRNPLLVIVPCHRVVGANGAPTGYAGGIQRKLWLLRHEARLHDP